MANVATLVARYNVLESMYQNWPGMTLHKDYENSLISLCIHVLRYLSTVFSISNNAPQKSPLEGLAKIYASITKADQHCRGFTVTIQEDLQNLPMVNIEEMSEDDD